MHYNFAVLPETRKRLSVIIPAFNEVKTITEILKRVHEVNLPCDLEVVVVDDHSDDGTFELISASLLPQIDILLRHDKNLGKGAALKSGFDLATGDFLIIQDADLEYNPKDYVKFLSPLMSNQADVVIGSRFLGEGPRRVHYYWHRVGNFILTQLSNSLTNLAISDMECCYVAITASVKQKLHLTEKRFASQPQLVSQIAQLHLRVFEVAVSYHGRTYSEGKKINWKDGIAALIAIIRYNLIQRLKVHKQKDGF